MTDAAPMMFEPLGSGPKHEGRSVWLPQLYLEVFRSGANVIENRIFVDCLIEGPAVLLPIEGCRFDDCFLGSHGGKPKALMLTPMDSQEVLGVVPFRNTLFQRCRFEGVGFTGNALFLGELLALAGGVQK